MLDQLSQERNLTQIYVTIHNDAKLYESQFYWVSCNTRSDPGMVADKKFKPTTSMSTFEQCTQGTEECHRQADPGGPHNTSGFCSAKQL